MKSTMMIRRVLIISVLMMIFSSCGKYLPWADGPENEIQIFVSKNDLEEAKELVGEVLSRNSVDVKQEPYYTIRYRDPSQFDELQKRHNIVIFALADGINDNGNRLIKQLISDGKLGTYVGDDQVWVTDDVFALGQVVAIVKGSSLKDLQDNVKLKGNWLFDQFDARYLERIKEHLYEINEQTDISADIFNRYDWAVRVPHDFIIIQEDRLANFLQLGRDFPRRWFAVHWTDESDGIIPHQNSVKSKIINLAKRFFSVYQFVETDLRPWNFSKIKINDRDVWRVEGRWETASESAAGGGPFISYIFYEDATKRLFHLNMLLFNPNGKKLMFLREMEAMARTFTINYEEPSRISIGKVVLIAGSVIMLLVIWSLWNTWKRQKHLTETKLNKVK